MSKKSTDKPKKQTPRFVEELLTRGTVEITSLTREEIDYMLADIPAEVKYSCGAVGYNCEVGFYVLRLDLINS